MARKSRKESGVQTRESFSKTIGYQVGFYLRLSDKEAKERDSESIENQFALLKDFIKNKPDFRLISTFTDDGKTGTNFRRSGFEQMMDEVRNGRIEEVGNKVGVPSSIHQKAVERYEKLMYQPLSKR